MGKKERKKERKKPLCEMTCFPILEIYEQPQELVCTKVHHCPFRAM
ncbi:rCG50303 [Rattus norvegicus]|uniref:RCG50303 n=1 Tax=Rattus norvegicus TaxID=10116 RepID=A6JZ37_RAT|nr:rCG50303 [Rattus norvegicus]